MSNEDLITSRKMARQNGIVQPLLTGEYFDLLQSIERILNYLISVNGHKCTLPLYNYIINYISEIKVPRCYVNTK